MRTSKLRIARAALGLSQSDLAKMSGCSRALISMVENGYVIPRPATAKRIAEAAGLTHDPLFQNVEDEGGD